jgi:tetratricopeptide (TPR) repeat protein
MKRNLILISIIGIIMFASLAAGISYLSTDNSLDSEAISVANQLYDSGRYQEAAQVYEQLLSQGVVNSTLYYNLGNTYLVQGNHGRAILNYQRAARLAPRDPDIKTNLEIARNRSGNKFAAEAANPIQSLSGFTSSWLTLNEMGITALVIWFILGFLVFGFRQLQSGKLCTLLRYGMVLVALLFVAAGLSLGSRLYVERTTPEAVIVADVVTLNSDPGDEFATEFQLFSGTEVKILDTQGSWAHLAGPNEAIDGWIPLSSIETVSWRSEPGPPIYYQ